MQGLWDEEIKTRPPQRSKQAATTPAHPLKPNALQCRYYGHTWEVIGMSWEKQCTVCGIKGYCPGCTSNPPQDAQPFSCTKHTPRQHQEVRI
ncbi:MAG: hypothetical protein ACRDIV_00320 [Ktedonobacteraceae bacterium]